MNTRPDCLIDDCAAPQARRGLCNKHRLRLQRHGDPHHARPTPKYTLACVIDGCELHQSSKGLCSKHLYRQQKWGDPHYAPIHIEKHGLSEHPLYKTWQDMKARCHIATSDSYPRYGGRGIHVCDRWRFSFTAFLEDVGERPPGCTLDRIDNAGHYEPENVRWASSSTQQKNQRTRCDNTSGHKGVSWDKRRSVWRAYKGGGPSRVELGSFRELADAIDARHRATADDPDVVCCSALDGVRQSA